jgi:CubicO group peptidase (beta-lactamase class C family)
MKMRISKWIFVVGALLLAVGALFRSLGDPEQPTVAAPSYTFDEVVQYDPRQDYVPEQRWGRLASPEQAGWSRERLDAVKAFAEEIHSDALLVVHDGLVVLDFGDITSKFALHSVRKSLMSVMYGIYHDRGVLDTAKTLKELAIEDVGGLTEGEKHAKVSDILTSMSGVYHTAAYETQGMRERRPEREAYRPGEHWFYNNWDFNVLSTIFNEQTKIDFFDAFARDLATPLGMEHFHVDDTRYRYEREKSDHPAYLFRMSALDLARIGLLYVRKGEFNGKQVVSKDWIDRSTSALHVWDETKPTAGYGYMWKVTDDGFYAAGRGGQRLFVVPKHDLVIAHLVDTTGRKRVKNSDVRTLYRMILAAYQPEKLVSSRQQ